MCIKMKNIGRKIFHIIIIAWVMILVNSGDLLAQCAMCKASVETNMSEDGVGFASKLNFGIMYLFAAPYLLAMVIGYLWYKKSNVHKREFEKVGVS